MLFNELLMKNQTAEKTTLTENDKKHLKLLKTLTELIINGQFDSARSELSFSFIGEENIFENHQNEMDSVYFGVERDSMSYKDYMGIAKDCILHSNYILFYGMLYMIRYKLNTMQRLFFDDYESLGGLINILAELIGEEVNSDVDYKAQFYYEHCIKYPLNSMDNITTKMDYACFVKGSFGTGEDCNLEYIKDEFEFAKKEKNVREFIIKLERCFYNPFIENTPPEVWDYYVQALLFDFSTNPYPWSRHLSKDILRGIISYSNSIKSLSIYDYNLKIKDFIRTTIFKINSSERMKRYLPINRTIAKERTPYYLGEFYCNLHCIFPNLDTNNNIGKCFEKIKFQDFKNELLKLNNQTFDFVNGEKAFDFISEDNKTEPKINNVFIHNKVVTDNFSYALIIVEANHINYCSYKIKYKLLDENNNEIVVSENPEQYFHENIVNTMGGANKSFSNALFLYNCPQIEQVSAEITDLYYFSEEEIEKHKADMENLRKAIESLPTFDNIPTPDEIEELRETVKNSPKSNYSSAPSQNRRTNAMTPPTRTITQILEEQLEAEHRRIEEEERKQNKKFLWGCLGFIIFVILIILAYATNDFGTNI